MMTRWCVLVAVVLATAGLARAECDPTVDALTADARTGIAKLNYLRCHSEAEYDAMVQQLWDNLGVSKVCVTLQNPAATDDDIPFFIAVGGTEIVSIDCRVTGTCVTPPTFDVTDNEGDVISPASTVTCATGTAAATAQSTLGDSDRTDVTAGKSPRLNITNTPSWALAQICVKFKATLE